MKVKRIIYLLIMFSLFALGTNAQDREILQAYFNSMVRTPDYLFDPNYNHLFNDSIEERASAARRRAEEETAARRRAEEEAINSAGRRLESRFGNGNRPQQESSIGNESRQGNNYGQSVGGVGVSARVGSRKVLSLPKPAYADQTSQGTVTVSIVVNKAGNVVSANVTSGNTSQALKNAALAAAKKAKFSEGDNNAERGTITYKFTRQ